MLQQTLDDSRCGLSIPVFGDATVLGMPLEYLLRFRDDPRLAGSTDDARALGNGHRTVGVLTKSQAGDAQHSGILLNPPGIRQDKLRTGHQAQRVQIAQRSDDPQIRPPDDPSQ